MAVIHVPKIIPEEPSAQQYHIIDSGTDSSTDNGTDNSFNNGIVNGIANGYDIEPDSSDNGIDNGRFSDNGTVNAFGNGIDMCIDNGIDNGIVDTIDNGIGNGINNGIGNRVDNGIDNGIGNRYEFMPLTDAFTAWEFHNSIVNGIDNGIENHNAPDVEAYGTIDNHVRTNADISDTIANDYDMGLTKDERNNSLGTVAESDITGIIVEQFHALLAASAEDRAISIQSHFFNIANDMHIMLNSHSNG
mmetsp:Transcript_2842/g.9582  ORF Transcript_2842/g.9582 Transcript_2842/m.9582 type:complete len:247 (+) Transcript_2842:65-805(+)